MAWSNNEGNLVGYKDDFDAASGNNWNNCTV